MSNVLRAWLGMYDPIHRGWTRAGIANGVSATNGFSFPRIRGGYNLYRMVSGDAASYELVGAAGADAAEIGTFGWVRHDALREYDYRLVPVGGGGVENWTDVTRTTVRFDGSGMWIGSLPNAPTDLQAAPLSLGRVVVRWTYLPQGEQASPAGFNLYTNEGREIDYGSLAGQVPYRAGRVHYEHVTNPTADGLRVGWAVRAFATSGHEEQNTRCVFTLTRGAGPPVNPVVKVAVV